MTLEIKIKGNKIFAPLKGKELVASPEERIRQEYIVHLVNTYGYSLDQMEQEVQVNNSKRGQGKARADIVIWRSQEDKIKSKKPVIVVECKAEQISIREEDFYQGFNYASWAGAKFFVTTNLKSTKFFRVNEEKMPNELDEIIEIPKASELNNERVLEELLNKTKIFTRDEFSKLLFKCHSIIRNNDKLSPEAAFDEISKILFMKIRYERDQAKTKALFSKEEFEHLKDAYQKTTGKKSVPFYQYLFDQTKEAFEDDEIFDPNDSIKVRETSFLQLVKELEKYNLSDTSDDVKGIAFEEFLGKTFRGELGQFFTPRTVVNYMVEVLDPQEGEKICDPCCGSGGFLIKAFEYVREKIEHDIHGAKEKIKSEYYGQNFDRLPLDKQEEIVKRVDELFAKLNYELDLTNEKGRLKTLSYDCIFGTDANPRMARTAKMNMIMHGDGHGGVHHHDGLLNVNGIFDGRFDVILTNPPFGSRVERSLRVTEQDIPSVDKIKKYKQRYENYENLVVKPLKEWANFDNGSGKPKGKALLDLFDVGKMSGLTEVLFIERCLRLLKPGGRMGIVLPEGVLNNSALQRIREYFEGKAKLVNITSIPQDVFIASGATVKPSLLFLKKFTPEEEEAWQEINRNTRTRFEAEYKVLIVAERKKVEDAKAKFDLLVESAAKKKKNANSQDVKKKKLQLNEAEKSYKKLVKEVELKEKELLEKMESEIRLSVKDQFNYDIPVIKVNYAGITSTGAPCENELVQASKDFTEYNREHVLWRSLKTLVNYPINEDGDITRAWIIDGIVSEPESFYGQ